jgi:two-component system sensor histidine kinase PilS (NtrC family)
MVKKKSREFKNLLALPLKIKNDILGVIKVENKKQEYGDNFTDNDMQLFTIIANVIALAIENARLYEQLETLLKTASSKAAHKINNQVSTYDYAYSVLKEEASKWLPNKSNLGKLADRVLENTKDLKKMTEDFKRFGKPPQPQKKLNQVNDMLQEEVENAQREPTDIQIKLEPDANIPAFNFDKGLLSENIRELLRNAKRVARGHIWVSSQLIEEENRKFARIIIEDDGQGIKEDFPIFTPFHSTRSDGTGLGLATVKDSVVAHGGEVNLNRQKGNGACFEIVLPLDKGE